MVACHHKAGSCSLHRGWGVSKVYSEEATEMIFPAASIKRALVAVVEESIPMK
jgi:hypothetical protein